MRDGRLLEAPQRLMTVRVAWASSGEVKLVAAARQRGHIDPCLDAAVPNRLETLLRTVADGLVGAPSPQWSRFALHHIEY
jgi:hypothetical protein